MGCKFCYLFVDNQEKGKPEKEENIILFESKNFLAVPAIGSILPGYIMVISKSCIPSMGLLDDTDTKELLSFVELIVDKLSHKYSSCTIFEHGSSSSSSTSASITHAHWHIVPHVINAENWEKKANSYTSFIDFKTKFNCTDSYLLLINNKYGIRASKRINEQKQFFRKILTDELDNELVWDYTIEPYTNNIKKTIEEFKI